MPKKMKDKNKTKEQLISELEEMRQELAGFKKSKKSSISKVKSIFLYEDIINKIPIGLYIYQLEDINDDHTLMMIAANSASEIFTGVAVKGVVGKTLDQNFPYLRKQGIPQLYADIVRSKKSKNLGDVNYGDKRVNRGWFSVEAFPLANNCIGVSFVNINKRKQIEEALVESKERYRGIIQSTTNCIAVYKPVDNGQDFVFVEFNYMAEKTEKISKNNVIGKKVTEVFPGIVEFGLFEVFQRVYKTGKAEHFPISIYKDSRVQGYRENHIYKLLSGEIVAVYKDLTEAKQLEIDKNKLKEQLIQAQKMEAIGTLAGGIAHDFNNMLGVIIGYSEMILDSPDEIDKVEDRLQNVLIASNRAKDMVDQILTFSRKNESFMGTVNIGEIIKETITFLRASIPATIRIRSNIEKSLELIVGNATQINQVLMNLCTNASHAMKEEGGLLEINLKKVILESDNSNILGLKPGKYQQLTVSDTGHGMDKELIKRIFEPYFTTKKTGEGTGMGLSVAYGIVKDHNGEIKLYSEFGKGTTFNVYFPILDTDKIKEVDIDHDNILMGNGERILFVEDEKIMLELGSQMLEKLGYQVESISNSIDALEIFRSKPDQFDLIVTDMTMPDMTGIKLAEEIHKLKPKLPIVLCTGFSKGISKENFKLKGLSALVMKPFTRKELGEVILEILEKRPKKK